MIEPIYTYMKGQGWVVAPKVVTKTHDGVEVYVECRKPVHGEYFFCGYGPENMKKNVQHINDCTLKYFPVWGIRAWRAEDESHENLVVITLV